MAQTFRIFALTAALSALSPAAFAVLVPLDFNDIGARADVAGKPIEVNVLEGLQFTNAYGYGVGMLTPADDDGLFRASTGKGGFLLNKPRGGSTADITISFVASRARAVAPAAIFESITFDLFTNGDCKSSTSNPNQLIAISAKGEVSQEITCGGNDRWSGSPLTYKFAPSDQITSLRFTADGATFALDNMIVSTLADPGNGNNVPEPASYGLVGLALLAAGSASRRKQRG